MKKSAVFASAFLLGASIGIFPVHAEEQSYEAALDVRECEKQLAAQITWAPASTRTLTVELTKGLGFRDTFVGQSIKGLCAGGFRKSFQDSEQKVQELKSTESE